MKVFERKVREPLEYALGFAHPVTNDWMWKMALIHIVLKNYKAALLIIRRLLESAKYMTMPRQIPVEELQKA